jgi:hypothetical protein
VDSEADYRRYMWTGKRKEFFWVFLPFFNYYYFIVKCASVFFPFSFFFQYYHPLFYFLAEICTFLFSTWELCMTCQRQKAHYCCYHCVLFVIITGQSLLKYILLIFICILFSIQRIPSFYLDFNFKIRTSF